ncbi:MAG: GIY-YIG nuclease family protein [Gemmatimonadota bacterium]
MHVYLLTNRHHTTIYTGVARDLKARVWQHRAGIVGGFTKRYNCHMLVYFEVFQDAYNAISREKQIKAGSRAAKVKLILGFNPDWRDLYDDL